MSMLILESDFVQRVTTLLEEANGRRRLRLLAIGEVMEKVEASKMASVAWAHAGSTQGWPRTLTTLVLAARVDGWLYVGVTACPASNPSPGRAWKCLQPWRQDETYWEFQERIERLRRWTKEPTVILAGSFD